MIPSEHQHLLNLARETILARVNGAPLPSVIDPAPALQTRSGCFVTITQRKQLRGCIGTFVSEQPLWETVREMAISAATRDPRFRPMQPEELADFHLEISVLSPLRDIASVDEIDVGTHGIYVIKGAARGVLLPQVAVEYGWDRETFLRQTCRKAGLPEDAWHRNCRILVFTAEIFGDQA